MGQAAPTQPNAVPIGPVPTIGDAAPSADDLLAQLAGEEIDRLLAETDNEPIRPATAPAPAPAAEAPAEPANAIDSSIDTVEKMGDQLDALLKEIETPPKPPESESQIEAPANTLTIAQMGATSSNEVNALLGDEITDTPDVADDDGAPIPLYVRALEIMNAPFDALPNALRELLGKVAILTLFNSIAVLLYVLIFRRN